MLRPRPDLTDVYGWLALLVIFLLVVRPGLALWSWGWGYGPAIANGGWTAVHSMVTAIVAVSVAVNVSGGYALARGSRPRAAWWAAACLWLGGPVATAMTAVVLDAMGVQANIGQIMGAAMLSAGIAFAWSLYLLLSRRVRNTYGFTKPAIQP